MLLIFVLLELVIVAVNYKPGTFLVGWDNVFSELNPSHAFTMNLNSVWQEYRGLGVEDGLAHAANIMHTLLIFLLVKILPLPIIRYFFQFLMHLVGGIGMFFFLTHTLKRPREYGLVGGLFYQLNLATVQMFYAPLEVFSVHFAALPILIGILIHYLHKPSKKRLFVLALLNILFTPQGFVPTVFIAYMVGVISVCVAFLFQDTFKKFKYVLLVGSVIVLVNSFWLLPFAHAAMTQGDNIRTTKINLLSSEEILEKNNRRGAVSDVVNLRGFMLDTTESDKNGEFNYIMSTWREITNSSWYMVVGFVFAALAFLGVISAIQKKELYLVPAIAVAFFMLGTQIPLLGEFNWWLRGKIPLFGEAFRFPFTKFSLLFVFCYSTFISLGLERLLSFIKSVKFTRMLILAFIFVLFVAQQQIFKGNFFYDSLRLTIPAEYFQLISFFQKQQADGRIMTLPQPSYSNWMFYTWGGRGSGFWWYGVKQAVLERPFDPWSKLNEQYFNELHYALQLQDSSLLQNVISKYAISHIVLDGWVKTDSKVQESLKLDKFIRASLPVVQVEKWGNITVYTLSPKRTVGFMNNLKEVSYSGTHEYIDQAYYDSGDYVANTAGAGIVYAFPNLFTNLTQDSLDFTSSLTNGTLTLTVPLDYTLDRNAGQALVVGKYSDYEQYVDTLVRVENDKMTIEPAFSGLEVFGLRLDESFVRNKVILSLPKGIDEISFNGEPIPFGVTKHVSALTKFPNIVIGKRQHVLTFTSEYLFKDPELKRSGELLPGAASRITINIGENILDSGNYKLESPCSETERFIDDGISTAILSDTAVSLLAKTASTCFHQYFSQAKQSSGVVIAIVTNYQRGLTLRVVVDNPQQSTNVIDSKLSSHSLLGVLLVPPTTTFDYEGYGFHARAVSYDQTISETQIQGLYQGYIPYRWLKTIRLVPVVNETQVAGSDVTATDHPLPSVYMITGVVGGIVQIPQAFDKGWDAYVVPGTGFVDTYFPYISGKKLIDHVLVNNWANGWKVASHGSSLRQDYGRQARVTGQQNIVIVFWPQYLEYIGFGLVVVTLLVVVLFPKRRVERE
jgi:hypothetical protein